MKIGFFEIEGWEKDEVAKALPSQDLFFSQEKIGPDDIPENTDFEVLSVFVNSRITKEVLEKFPNLKLIATRSTGYDHVDVVSAREKGIEVVYVPGYGDNTVAEYAFGLLLSLTRKIYQAVDQVKEMGNFSVAGLRGVDLKGKTIGIVGTGRIGKEAVRIARGFGMKVVCFDAKPDLVFASDNGIEYLALPDLLACSDMISIHCPLLPSTRHLINKENIKLIKRGSYDRSNIRCNIKNKRHRKQNFRDQSSWWL